MHVVEKGAGGEGAAHSFNCLPHPYDGCASCWRTCYNITSVTYQFDVQLMWSSLPQ